MVSEIKKLLDSSSRFFLGNWEKASKEVGLLLNYTVLKDLFKSTVYNYLELSDKPYALRGRWIIFSPQYLPVERLSDCKAWEENNSLKSEGGLLENISGQVEGIF